MTAIAMMSKQMYRALWLGMGALWIALIVLLTV